VNAADNYQQLFLPIRIQADMTITGWVMADEIGSQLLSTNFDNVFEWFFHYMRYSHAYMPAWAPPPSLPTRFTSNKFRRAECFSRSSLRVQLVSNLSAFMV
jgi:hypothetical protein